MWADGDPGPPPTQPNAIAMLAHQSEACEVLRVHAQQGGLCLVQEAFRLHRTGKMLVPIIDDAHLMQAECLRKLRLLFEDFPRSHNLVLIGQPPLMQTLALSINEEIRSRVTYSVLMPRLAPETIERFILDQFDAAGLAHNIFTLDALALVVRASEGLLRRTRNLCLAALIEAVRDQTRTVDLKHACHAIAGDGGSTRSSCNPIRLRLSGYGATCWRKDYDAPAP